MEIHHTLSLAFAYGKERFGLTFRSWGRGKMRVLDQPSRLPIHLTHFFSIVFRHLTYKLFVFHTIRSTRAISSSPSFCFHRHSRFVPQDFRALRPHCRERVALLANSCIIVNGLPKAVAWQHKFPTGFSPLRGLQPTNLAYLAWHVKRQEVREAQVACCEVRSSSKPSRGGSALQL